MTSKNITYFSLAIFIACGLFDSLLSFIVLSEQHFVKIFNFGRYEEVQNSLPNISSFSFLIAFIVVIFLFDIIIPLTISIFSIWIAHVFHREGTFTGMISLTGITYILNFLSIFLSFSLEYSNSIVLQISSLAIVLWIFFNIIMFYKIITDFSFVKSLIIIFISLTVAFLLFAFVEQVILLLFKLVL